MLQGAEMGAAGWDVRLTNVDAALTLQSHMSWCEVVCRCTSRTRVLETVQGVRVPDTGSLFSDRVANTGAGRQLRACNAGMECWQATMAADTRVREVTLPLTPSPPLPPLAFADCVVFAADKRWEAEAARSYRLLYYHHAKMTVPSVATAASGRRGAASPELSMPAWLVSDCCVTSPPLPPAPAPRTALSTVVTLDQLPQQVQHYTSRAGFMHIKFTNDGFLPLIYSINGGRMLQGAEMGAAGWDVRLTNVDAALTLRSHMSWCEVVCRCTSRTRVLITVQGVRVPDTGSLFSDQLANTGAGRHLRACNAGMECWQATMAADTRVREVTLPLTPSPPLPPLAFAVCVVFAANKRWEAEAARSYRLIYLLPPCKDDGAISCYCGKRAETGCLT